MAFPSQKTVSRPARVGQSLFEKTGLLSRSVVRQGRNEMRASRTPPKSLSVPKKKSLVLAVIAPRYRGNQFGVETGYLEALSKRVKERGHQLVVIHPARFTAWKPGKKLRVSQFAGGAWEKGHVKEIDVVLRRFGEIGGADKFRKLQKKVPFFNPYDVRSIATDKLHFAQLMHGSGLAHPKTELFDHESPGTFLDFLDRHTRVFVKPRSGTMGRGVIHAAKLAGGKIKIRYKIPGERPYTYSVKTIRASRADVPSVLKRAMVESKGGLKQYIMQNSVSPLSYNERPFSLRVMVHQPPGQKPFVIGSQARVEFENSFMVSNGLGHDIHKVVGESLGIRGAELEKKVAEIHGACVRAFGHCNQWMQKTHGQKITELGYDVLLDHEGKPVIIEANSRPQILANEPLMSPALLDHMIDTAEKVAKTKNKSR